jgi:hypothetical protein
LSYSRYGWKCPNNTIGRISDASNTYSEEDPNQARLGPLLTKGATNILLVAPLTNERDMKTVIKFAISHRRSLAQILRVIADLID